ncbi:sigma-54 interaction domain-containing protein [Anoxynatronum buryatiense]|uniref:PAS domain S-box-containing protein n=1 Tax=Anoxynatronum buryatiense TaxID=489973 RepID=A0AA46AJT1_9CLOT|nr:sigma 54-interacting transcriptional regulator [Anoxynatronum buryatiense]SMP62821.1 PAS domain S-box-containing protein [Anoxynatronum buryatiense]
MNKHLALLATSPDFMELICQQVSLSDIHIQPFLIQQKGHVPKEMMDHPSKWEAILYEGSDVEDIQQYFSIPVIQLQVDDCTIMQELYKASQRAGSIAMVFDRKRHLAVDLIEELLGIQFREVLIRKGINRELLFRTMAAHRVELIVTEECHVREARQFGFQVSTYHCGIKALEKGLKEAAKAIELRRKEQYQKEYVSAVLNYAQEGIIAVDEKGCITAVNPVAAAVLGIEVQHVIGGKAVDHLPNTRMDQVIRSKVSELGKLQKIDDGRTILVNRVPILHNGSAKGAVSTFKDVTRFQELEKQIRSSLYLKGHYARYALEDIIGQSERIREVITKIRLYAASKATVLISGESGTGKELAAHCLHQLSERAKGPFVAVNCATIQENLMESEFFGYEEGAFTGAVKGGKKGLFALAHGGTIFLDEIDGISKQIQLRLLRVLQEREIRPVGSSKILPVDVRVIAATNSHMGERVRQGQFQGDLYYRLNTLEIEMPPLRNRREDIPLLVDFFLKKHGRNQVESQRISVVKTKEPATAVCDISAGALEILKNLQWEGNVRELENTIERLIALMPKDGLITPELVAEAMEGSDSWENEKNHVALPLDGSLADLKRRIIQETLLQCCGHRKKTAERLEISPVHLSRLLKEMDM